MESSLEGRRGRDKRRCRDCCPCRSTRTVPFFLLLAQILQTATFRSAPSDERQQLTLLGLKKKVTGRTTPPRLGWQHSVSGLLCVQRQECWCIPCPNDCTRYNARGSYDTRAARCAHALVRQLRCSANRRALRALPYKQCPVFL